jgi:hypothetical protein
MPFFTVASLLIEVSARVKEVVDAVHVLATLARFKPADGEGGEKPRSCAETWARWGSIETSPQSGTKVYPLNDDASHQDLTP